QTPAERVNIPIFWNSAKARLLQVVRSGVAEAALNAETLSEEVVHKPGLDPLLFGQQRLRLLNRTIQSFQNACDGSLLVGRMVGDRELAKKLIGYTLLPGRPCHGIGSFLPEILKPRPLEN